MRVIGRVEGIFTDSGECLNIDYLDGSIVELTSREVHILKALQDSCANRNWKSIDMFHHERLDNADMAETFDLIWMFTKTRFAVNDFKSTVNELEEILSRLDKANEL